MATLAWLTDFGIETLRVPAIDVLRDADAVADMIMQIVKARRGGQ